MFTCTVVYSVVHRCTEVYRSRQCWPAPGAGCPNFSRYSSPAKERDSQLDPATADVSPDLLITDPLW